MATDPSPWRIKPALGLVLVKPMRDEEVSKGGIILPFASEKETHISEVVEVCDPYEAVATDRSIQKGGPIYPIGTLVIVGKYNGRELTVDRQKFILLRESDVLGTLEDKTLASSGAVGDSDGVQRSNPGSIGGSVPSFQEEPFVAPDLAALRET